MLFTIKRSQEKTIYIIFTTLIFVLDQDFPAQSGTVFLNSHYFAVMLQPFEYDAAENKRHKFMVQTMVVSNDTQDIEHMVSKLFTENFFVLLISNMPNTRSDFLF